MSNAVMPPYVFVDREDWPAAGSRAQARRREWGILAFFAGNIILAMLMRESSMVSTIHALLTLVVGLWAALSRRYELVVYVGGYICGVEVLWRMTMAGVFYEYGKYAVVVIFGLALLRLGRLRSPGIPIFFFALLIPSAVITYTSFQFSDARELISFNLSGPLALSVCLLYGAFLRITREHLYKTLIAIAAPVAGLAAVTIFSTVTATNLEFTGESNMITSGGFGPNQVSSTLGLGVLLSFLYLINVKGSRLFKIAIFILLLAMAVQSALTFSRSGLYSASISAALALIYIARDNRTRIQALVLVAVLFTLGYFVVLPQLDNFTGGKFSERFRDTDTTGRTLIFAADIEAWRENIMFGTGPGMSESYHNRYFYGVSSHTEFSRLLGEHGTLGLIAFLLLMVSAFKSYHQAKDKQARAVVIALLSWAFLFMLGTAMRLVAPAYLLGLACATYALDEEEWVVPEMLGPLGPNPEIG